MRLIIRRNPSLIVIHSSSSSTRARGKKIDRRATERPLFLRIDSNWKGPYGSAAAVPEPTAAAAIVDECLLLLAICDDDKPE